MGDYLLAELEQHGVDTEYSFRADAASPRTLILLDDTGERTIIALDSGAAPSSFLPVRGPDHKYTRAEAETLIAMTAALLRVMP